MTTTALAPKQKTPVDTLGEFFYARKTQLATVAARGMDIERATKIVLASVAKTPALLKCSPASIYQSVHQALQLGLEPGGPLGHAYLVPYGSECALIVGYKGLVALALRSGEIATIEARAVFKKDVFRVSFGTDPKIEHEPFFAGDPGECVAVYAVATMRSGEKQFDVMSFAETEAIRAKSKSGAAGPWATFPTEMRKKTIVRRLSKMLPLTIEAAEQLSAEDEADRGAPVMMLADEEAPTRADAEREALNLPAAPPSAREPGEEG